MSGIGAPIIHDWHAYYLEFVEANEKEETFLNDWAKRRGLNYTNTSRQFSKIEREQENHRLAHTRAKLNKLAPKAVDTLERQMQSDDEKIATTAAVAILDRAGLAPAVATTRITNIQAGNGSVIIPPLFAGSYQTDAERMLGGAINLGSAESSSEPVEGGRVIESTDSGQAGGSGAESSGPGNGDGRGPGRPRKARKDSKAGGTDSGGKP